MTAQNQSSSFLHKNKRTILLSAFLFILSFLVRAWAAQHGKPFCYHNDEHWIFNPALEMAQNHTWDPQWYTYSPLLAMLFRAAITLFTWIHPINLAVPHEIWMNPEAILPHQFPLLYMGRLIIALFGSCTVVLIFMILQEWADESWAFIFSFLYSFLFTNIHYSSFLRPEPLMIFFLTGTLFSLCKYQTSNKKLWLYTAGLCLGFAAGSKYNAGFYILSCFVFLTFIHHDKKKTAQDFIRLSAASFVSFLISTPQLLWKADPVIGAISRNFHIYKIGQIGDRGTHLENFFFYIDHLKGDTNLSLFFGILIISLLATPFLWKITKKESQPIFASSLFFIFSYVFFLCCFRYRAERNLIIILPFVFISICLFLFQTQNRFGKFGKPFIASILIYTAFSFSKHTSTALQGYNRKLPQDYAMEWVEKNIPKGMYILKEFESPLLDPATHRVGHTYAIGLFSAQDILKIDADYFITNPWIDNAMMEVPNPFVKKFYMWLATKEPLFINDNLEGIPMGIRLRIYNFKNLKDEFKKDFAEFLKTPDQTKTN